MIRIYFIYGLIYILVLLTEVFILPFISIKGVTPDLSLVFLVFVSLKKHRSFSTAAGFLTGLIHDLFTINILGISSLSRAITCFSMAYFKDINEEYSYLSLGIITFIAATINETIFQLIHSVGSYQHFWNIVITYVLPRAIFTLICCLLINLILSKHIWRKPRFK